MLQTVFMIGVIYLSVSLGKDKINLERTSSVRTVLLSQGKITFSQVVKMKFFTQDEVHTTKMSASKLLPP